MWVAEIAVPGIINASKWNTQPWWNFEEQKCCDAQQLPNGFRSGVGIGGHGTGWASSADYKFFLTSALGQKQTSEGV
jgi:hypothetical protein